MPTYIIFDLGGVLINWDPRHLYRKLFNHEAEMEEFLATVCTSEWNEQQDAGRPLAEAVAELTAQWPEKAALIQAFYDRWPEMLGGAKEETVELLAELRARHVPLFALTNWSAETFPYALKHFEFLSWFQGIIVSGEEKVKKPDLRLYRLLLERYALNPRDGLFIDDNAGNVEAARKIGLQSLHFTNAQALRGELVRLGLLI